jgi:hypothetical protein
MPAERAGIQSTIAWTNEGRIARRGLQTEWRKLLNYLAGKSRSRSDWREPAAVLDSGGAQRFTQRRVDQVRRQVDVDGLPAMDLIDSTCGI